jgi:hypothetical protein
MTTPVAAGLQAQHENIAHVCHEAFRAWCATLGDTANPPWEQAEDWRRAFELDGVRHVLAGASPSEIHDLWRSRKTAAGWTYGAQKAPAVKQAANLVPYDQIHNSAEMKKAALFTSTALTLGCGVERWAVKTLTDPDAPNVNLTPASSSVHDLVAIAAPAAPTARVSPTEFTTYQVTADLTYAKLETDSDIHMVLNDPGTGETMIIEAACPSCAQGSVVADQIAQVRQVVEAQFPEAVAGTPQDLAASPLHVTVTGVAFFDYAHGQRGLASNGIELHPLLSFAVSG